MARSATQLSEEDRRRRSKFSFNVFGSILFNSLAAVLDVTPDELKEKGSNIVGTLYFLTGTCQIPTCEAENDVLPELNDL